MRSQEECVDNGGISGIWESDCQRHLASQAPADQEFGMFRRWQIYSLYLEAKGRRVFRQHAGLASSQLMENYWDQDLWGSGWDLNGVQ